MHGTFCTPSHAKCYDFSVVGMSDTKDKRRIGNRSSPMQSKGSTSLRDMLVFLLQQSPRDRRSKVSTTRLLGLDGFKKTFKVSRSEALMVVSLDDLKEERRTVFDRPCKYLQQIAVLVIVDKYMEVLELVQGLLHRDAGRFELFPQMLVVHARNVQKFGTTATEGLDGADDVLCVHRNMLHTGTSVVIDILLNLALALAASRLIDRHLDRLVIIGHDNRAQRAVLCVDLRVIDRPKAMKGVLLFVGVADRHHLAVALISDNVIDEVQERRRSIDDITDDLYNSQIRGSVSRCGP